MIPVTGESGDPERISKLPQVTGLVWVDLGFEPSLIPEFVLMATELRKVSRDMGSLNLDSQRKSCWQATRKHDGSGWRLLFSH